MTNSERVKREWTSLSEDEYKSRCQAISEGTKVAMSKVTTRLKQEKEKFAKDNNLVFLSDITALYGTGYIQRNDCDIEIIKYKNCRFIHQEDVEKIKKYYEEGKIFHAKQTNLVKYGAENPMQCTEIKNKASATNLERYGATNVYASEYGKSKAKKTKLDKYGNENYNNREKTAKTLETRYGSPSYASTEDFKSKVKKTKQKLHSKNGAHSKQENTIIEALLCLDVKILTNKRLLGAQYIDIFLPDLNIGIEFNGNHWHSIEHLKIKEYHLNKSLVARKIGIRLIHIYEFENFKSQMNLLIDLINGKDNYPKNDFNKNNLIDTIPEPEIIYEKPRCTIYGAGVLF